MSFKKHEELQGLLTLVGIKEDVSKLIDKYGPAKTEFEDVMETVFKHEGGFVDDPDDAGGCTNMGLTQKTVSTYNERQGQDPPTRDDMANMTKELASEIYMSLFWQPAKCDRLPESIRAYYFDMYINHGPRNAGKILQQAVNTKLGVDKEDEWIDVDGIVGSGTIRGIEQTRIDLDDLMIERSGFFWNLVFDGSSYTKRTRQAKFIRGWTKRCFHL
tara:strand:+ start:263 stop:910 length:648 start_codon:yes stop_codon:yes gene_type:complete